MELSDVITVCKRGCKIHDDHCSSMMAGLYAVYTALFGIGGPVSEYM